MIRRSKLLSPAALFGVPRATWMWSRSTLLWLAWLPSMLAQGAHAQQALPAPPVPPATAAAERARADAAAPAGAQLQMDAAAPQPSAAAAASAQFQNAPPPQIEPNPPPGDAAPTDPAIIFPPAPPPIFAEPDAATPVPTTPPPSAADAVEPAATYQPPLPPPLAAASAVRPIEHPWSLGAAIGAGATFDHTIGGANPLGFGFGLRGEYRLHDEWSVGARTLFYVGSSSELPTGKVSTSSWLMAAEGSYVVDFAPVLVQPGLALGLMQRDLNGQPMSTLPQGTGFIPGSQSSTRYGLYVAPGVTITLPFGALLEQLELLFVAVDARLDFVFGSSVSSNVQMLLIAGIRI